MTVFNPEKSTKTDKLTDKLAKGKPFILYFYALLSFISYVIICDNYL